MVDRFTLANVDALVSQRSPDRRWESMRTGSRRSFQLETIGRDSIESFVLRDFRVPYFRFFWHYHPETELTLIVKGGDR